MQLKDTPDAFADARIEEKFIQYEKSRDSLENWGAVSFSRFLADFTGPSFAYFQN